MGEKIKQEIKLPVARLINNSLFERDAFKGARDDGKESEPKYKVEVAWPKADKSFDDFYNMLLEIADEEFPNRNYELDIDGGNLISGILDGDKLAADREARGKKGDAYKDMWVLRASTKFNYNGDPADGGAAVYDEQVKRIDAGGDRSKIWNGCYGHVVVKVGTYTSEDKRAKTKLDCFNFYLVAFQKTGGDVEKDKLSTSGDKSGLFKPVGREAAGAADGGRRRRPG